MLVVQASRENIEAGDIQPVLNILNSLIEPQNIRKFANRTMFCIDGYNTDPRELCEVPEVRKWLKMLDTEWPYWFYFSSPSCLTLKFLAFTLSEIQRDSRGQVFIDGDQLLKFMLEHFEAMNVLEDKGLITAVENFKVSKKIEKYFKDNAKPIIFNQ
ncbi:MAG: chlororespiratory reduction 6 domain-containing protein [Victivallales bacterium]